MENVRFKLKDYQKGILPSKQKDTLISLIFSYGYYEVSKKGNKLYVPMVYSTGLKIKPHQWNNKKYRAKQTNVFDYQSFNAVLDDLESFIKQIYRSNNNSNPKQLKERLDVKLNRKEEITSNYLSDYINQFIYEIESGIKKTTKGTDYKKSTIKAFVNFKNIFSGYSKIKLRFEDINMVFYKNYEHYLNDLDFSPNTIGKHFKILKTIMREARELKLHNNTDVENKAFKVTKIKVDKIYLSESEIQTIYKLDLSSSKTLSKYRDVFLVGCYTAQRFSDYSRINKMYIKKFDNVTVIDLVQVKTGERVIIPIRKELDHILQKYDYNLPKTHEQKLNELIKEIGKLAQIDMLIEIKKIKGGQTTTEIVPKYKLITTHTARRSGATNMYLAGIPSIDIMKLTGHKTESVFLNYIKTTKQETAINLSVHPFFN